jgi:hypothetical protein
MWAGNVPARSRGRLEPTHEEMWRNGDLGQRDETWCRVRAAARMRTLIGL